jgi:hypothetical protein
MIGKMILFWFLECAFSEPAAAQIEVMRMFHMISGNAVKGWLVCVRYTLPL